MKTSRAIALSALPIALGLVIALRSRSPQEISEPPAAEWRETRSEHAEPAPSSAYYGAVDQAPVGWPDVVIEHPSDLAPVRAAAGWDDEQETRVQMGEQEVFLQRFDAILSENPEMEDVIRNRLWLALDELHNPIVTRLGLTDEEIAGFKSLILERLVMAANEAWAVAPDGEFAFEAELDNALAAGRGEYEAELQELLGSERFAQYAAYHDDYARFNAVKFLGNSEPLTNEQAEAILAAMTSERFLVHNAIGQLKDGHPLGLSTEEITRSTMQRLINARVYARIEGLLSPEQFEALQSLMDRQ